MAGSGARWDGWGKGLLVRRTRLGAAVRSFRGRHPFALPAATLVAGAATTWALAVLMKPWTVVFYSDRGHFDALKGLFLGLGCALVGATALVFTIILFAMQVNVGRMPTPLFTRFANDKRLLTVFIATLMLSIGVAALSLSNLPDFSHWLIAAALWATAVTVAGFIFAYKRAISLTNPASQMQHLVKATNANLRRWGKLADASVDLLGAAPEDTTFDPRRLAFFTLNKGWDQEAKGLCEQILSYGSRLSEVGDHESFRLMLRGVIAVHTSYVRARGPSFINSNPLFEVAEARDPFLLSTLEHLRLIATGAAKRGDEQTCMTCFQVHTGLFAVYVAIAYSGRGDHKYHANLISSYLQSQVEATARHRMPDVSMEGARQIGSIGKRFILTALDSEGAQPAKKLANLAALGVIDESHYPLTQVAFQQLAEMTYVALASERPRGDYIFSTIRDSAFSSASLFIQMTNEASPLSNTHRVYLAPYFSTSDAGALLQLITQASNALTSGQLEGKEGQFIAGLAKWSDGLNRALKDLLLQTLSKPSSITFDLIHWPRMAASVLLETSASEHCTKHDRAALTANARAIVAVYTWIPTDAETVRTVAAYQLTELLFELAGEAKAFDADDVAESALSTLLRWSFSAGRHQLGRETLDHGLLLLAAHATYHDEPEAQLVDRLNAALGREADYSVEIRARAAHELRREAAKHRGADYALSVSERVLAEVDHPSLSRRLGLLADALTN